MADVRRAGLKFAEAFAKAGEEADAAMKAVKAEDRAKAGRQAADVARATAPMKMSEALGNMNVEGKGALKVTQSDRTRVGGGNIGGAMFPGLQQVNPFYEGAAWGVGDKGTASRLINQSDSNTLWSTVLGSADQLKTNPLVFNKLRRGFTDAMKEGKLSDELAQRINQNLALRFGEGADIRDPKIWQKANTFEKRALLADVMMGQGVAPGKGGVALGGEKSGKGVIFKPTDILKQETESLLLHPEHGGDVPTFAVGPRLFSLSGDVKQRPDLHPGFPYILQGEDKGVVFKPAPGELAMRDYVERFRAKNKRDPGYYDWTLGEKGVGLPSQPITEEYLTYLQKQGHKEGGAVNESDYQRRLDAMIAKEMGHADGGEIKPLQWKAEGGVIDNMTPDRADGGSMNWGGDYAEGGEIKSLPWKAAGGGFAKAAKAIQKASEMADAATAEGNLKKFLEPSKVQQRLYHGTMATEGGKGEEALRRLKPSKDGALGSGVYLTPNSEFASTYAGFPARSQLERDIATGSDFAKKSAGELLDRMNRGAVESHEVGGNMLPVYAQIKNPLMLEGKGDPMIEALTKLGMDEEKATRMVERAYENKGYIGKEVETRARAAGYDGLMQYRDGDLTEVVSYNPNAIKSAIGNRGTYDINYPDINKAGGGLAKLGKAVAKASQEADAMMPAVNRIDMNYKDVTKRVPELTEAAQKVAKGEMSPAEYDAIVNQFKPVMPYGFVPAPATAEDAMRALTENKRAMFGKTGEMTAGEQADLRLDIPAYKDHGVWVNSIHRKDAPTVYGSVSSVKNATMIGAPEKAMRVATGETAKAPFAVIRGEWNPMDEATAVASAQKYLKHKDWRQVGYDPERHGYFYDRHTMQPIEGAEEVIQIGPLVLAKKPRYGAKEAQKFDGGGVAIASPEEALTPLSDEPSKVRLMAEILARMAKEQGKEEIESLKKPRATTDLLNRGVVAPLAGLPVDLINMGLTGIDAVRELASGKRIENRLASEKPFLGSEHLKDLMDKYGMTSGEDRPMMETGLSLLSPVGAVKGAAKAAEVAPKALRAGEAGLNAATAAVRRPFTPATVTVEAVAPDLAKFKPRQWQETATKRLISGEDAPVSMSTMGGRKTTKRPGQGVYLNNAGQLETNPLVAVDIPFAGNLEKNKALRADIATAGQELGQEAMAAHRFVPMATNEIKDASAMLIKPKKGSLTDKQVQELGEALPGMIVAHNPRLGGVVVAPFEMPKGQIPKGFLDAQTAAQAILGKNAKITYGKSEQGKDLMYMGRSDYATEGARESSDASKQMRQRLQRAEKRLFPESGRSRSGLESMRGVQPATVD